MSLKFRDGVTGSTYDSGSYCLGSNPSLGAMASWSSG